MILADQVDLVELNPNKNGVKTELEPCEDCISRKSAIDVMIKLEQDDIECYGCAIPEGFNSTPAIEALNSLPTVTPKEKTGHCKDCKYFEYDSVAKVNGIPLIVAHEICSRWGDGCKTKEDGYCFLFEPQESEDKEVEHETDN